MCSGRPKKCAKAAKSDDFAHTDDSDASLSRSMSTTDASSSSDTSLVADLRIHELQRQVNQLQRQLESRQSATVPSTPLDMKTEIEQIFQQHQEQQQAAAHVLLSQFKMVKDIMTMMQPPTIVTAPTQSNVVAAPASSTPTFSLETFERIAKMFK